MISASNEILWKSRIFLGTDNATAEGGTSLGGGGGGSGGMLPRKIFKISMQIELFYSILGNNSLYFHCCQLLFRGIKDLLYRFFFHYVFLIFITWHLQKCIYV